MDVILREGGDVEVDHVAELVDVDAARGDVGGHQHLEAPVLERGQGLRPLALAAVPMDPLRLHPMAAEKLGEPVRPMLGPREGQDAPAVGALEDGEEEPRLQLRGHGVRGVGDPGGRGRRSLHLDRDRIAQHLAGEGQDRSRHRGREEEGLPPGGQIPQDAANVGQEAHVEHPVRLVDDEDLEPVEAPAAVRLAEVVEEATGRGDQDVDPGAQRLDLGAGADPAEDRRPGEPSVDREVPPVLVDLRGQLARGGEDEGARHAAARGLEAVEGRQEERRRLAAPRHGAGEDVSPGERGRDGIALDGRRRVEGHGGDAAKEVGMKAECGERHGGPRGTPGPGQSSAVARSRPTVRKRRPGAVS